MLSNVPCPDNLAWQLVFSKASAHACAVAVHMGTTSLTYADLQRLVHATAQALARAGVAQGDRIVLVLPNSPEYIVAFIAVVALGAIAVPLPASITAERLRAVIDDTAAKLCVVPSPYTAPDPMPVLAIHLSIDRDRLQPVLYPGPDAAANGDVALATSGSDAPAVILFSSGSTGRPKGVVLHHRHLLATARNLSQLTGIRHDHRELLLSSLCHSDGWQRASATLLQGGSVILPDGLLSVPGILEQLHEHRVTGFFTVPPLIRAMLRYPPVRVQAASATCRTVEIGSAPLAPVELAQFMALMPQSKIFVHYGLTECSRAFMLDARQHPDKLHTVGRAAPGVQVRIIDAAGAPLPVDQIGHILLRGDQQATRYWRRAALTAAKFHDGWLLTGDYGSIDAAGFLTYRGREDEMINCGGYSYYPAEVEASLGPVPGVAEYLVAGVTDAQGMLGEVPWAFVVPAQTPDGVEKTFLDAAHQRLPSHMIPRHVVLVPALVRTSSGKPDRRATAHMCNVLPGKA